MKRVIGMMVLVTLEVVLGAGLLYWAWSGVIEQKRFMNEVSRQYYPFALRDVPTVAKRMLLADALVGSWAVGWGIIASGWTIVRRRRPIPLGSTIWFRMGLVALFGFHVWRFVVSDRPSRGRLGIFLAGVGDDSGYAFFTHFTADIWLTALCVCAAAIALVFVAETVVNGVQALGARLPVRAGDAPRDTEHVGPNAVGARAAGR